MVKPISRTLRLPSQIASCNTVGTELMEDFCPSAQTSASPPHAVVVDAVADSVLLALDPEGAAEGYAQQDAQQDDAAPEEATGAEQDPRSLQGAVEALAKFTSETVAGASAGCLTQDVIAAFIGRVGSILWTEPAVLLWPSWMSRRSARVLRHL